MGRKKCLWNLDSPWFGHPSLLFHRQKLRKTFNPGNIEKIHYFFILHKSKILSYLVDFVMDPKLFWASFLVSVRSMRFFPWSYLVEWASVNYRGIFWDDKRKDSLYLSSVALTRWMLRQKSPPKLIWQQRFGSQALSHDSRHCSK